MPILLVVLFRISEGSGAYAKICSALASFIVGSFMGASGVGLIQLLIFRERLFLGSDIAQPGSNPFTGKWYTIGIC